MKGLIYKLSFNSSNFIIGSSINFKSRKRSYLKKLRRNIYSNNYVQNCYNKYGESSMNWEILQDNIPEDILIYVEDIWIGSQCSRIEDKKGGMNMRDAHRTRHTKETIEKIRIKSAGKVHSLDTRNKISNIVKGRKHTEESKKKMSEYHKNNYVPNDKRIPIIQYSKKGEFIREWDSIKEASESLDICKGEIVSVCKYYAGFKNRKRKINRKTAKGYIWKYKQN